MDDIDAYAEGLEAHDCGRPGTANPYDDASEPELWADWNDGWNFGCEQATDDEASS